MKNNWLWGFLILAATGCYQQDPMVRAAQDLQKMAYDMASQQEEQRYHLNSLHLGMTDKEVLDAVGPPSARQSIATNAEESREVWTYRGAVTPLATLTFVNQRLTEMRVE
ncbi:MAG: hypothetical protein HY268_23010 [Deltaproteobacteria bacterium]|nr:hypothetical protein [Deltaproteobacteria bacterium]